MAPCFVLGRYGTHSLILNTGGGMVHSTQLYTVHGTNSSKQ
jgi:hypothetical protein